MNRVTISSFTFNTKETGEIFVDVSNAMAAPLDDGGDDDVLLQIPVFCNGNAGHIYATPNEVARIGRSLLCQEAMMWSRKRARN